MVEMHLILTDTEGAPSLTHGQEGVLREFPAKVQAVQVRLEIGVLVQAIVTVMFNFLILWLVVVVQAVGISKVLGLAVVL
jgi:hypothetical protein